MLNQQLLSDWWEVWSTRILVAVGIMIAFELLQRRNKDAKVEGQVGLTSAPAQQEEELAASRKAAPRHDRQSRLLDELEERQKEQEISKTKTQTPNQAQPGDQHASKRKQKTKTSKKPTNSTAPESSNAPPTSTPTLTPTPQHMPPPMKATTNQHPGMKEFCHWCDVECSLFRTYTLGRNDDVEVVPPYVPHSYRGKVRLIFLSCADSKTPCCSRLPFDNTSHLVCGLRPIIL
jgi:hypothetical protein